ncbi:MAG: sigma-54-dependent Fis family transcriptional regulator [Acidobacteria bacterium]|nr:sigma-54-dependent Fis family transcriptional regulator [Acidobacteriota bacterium]MBA4122181.1 sigma-54-dependent Fis family transcriptional regulator [Acidobacteriota bacterium]MBA4183372.1 sigma-54-dependent Fis family transcriptional regulator [Acidobacteriota bacterium]
MNQPNQKILIADDDDSLRRVLEFQLQEAGYEVLTAENGTQALEIFSSEDVDCLITDWRMPQMSGAELLKRAGAINSETPIIVITAFGDVETAVEAMSGGAFDFITKPFNRQAILLIVEKALKYGAALAENRRLRRIAHEDFRLESVVGNSEKMRQVFSLVERVAQTDVTVLIEGESGTGKELIAKGIHFSSSRKDKSFVAINCAAIPETLIEAELFGYKKGAFTGATQESKGKFEEANGGTLFLDEISAMPLALQTRLLRVLQEQEITRLGENTTRKINVRIIAASNENLTDLIKQNEFREDLYYRLAVVPIKLPPLRERREDIPLLVEHFLKKSASKHDIKPLRIEREVFQKFFNYVWMGNVRELENVVERMVVLAGDETLTLEDIPENIKNPSDNFGNLWFSLPVEPINLETVEAEIIREALNRFDSNQSQTARYLGITRSALIYRMQKYGLE